MFWDNSYYFWASCEWCAEQNVLTVSPGNCLRSFAEGLSFVSGVTSALLYFKSLTFCKILTLPLHLRNTAISIYLSAGVMCAKSPLWFLLRFINPGQPFRRAVPSLRLCVASLSRVGCCHFADFWQSVLLFFPFAVSMCLLPDSVVFWRAQLHHPLPCCFLFSIPLIHLQVPSFFCYAGSLFLSAILALSAFLLRDSWRSPYRGVSAISHFFSLSRALPFDFFCPSVYIDKILVIFHMLTGFWALWRRHRTMWGVSLLFVRNGIFKLHLVPVGVVDLASTFLPRSDIWSVALASAHL